MRKITKTGIIYILCSYRKNEIQKDGVGIFEKAPALLVTYNEEEYEITDPDIVNEFSKLCDLTPWKNPDKKTKQELCDLKIIFVNARATLYIQTNQNLGFLNDIPRETSEMFRPLHLETLLFMNKSVFYNKMSI